MNYELHPDFLLSQLNALQGTRIEPLADEVVELLRVTYQETQPLVVLALALVEILGRILSISQVVTPGQAPAPYHERVSARMRDEFVAIDEHKGRIPELGEYFERALEAVATAHFCLSLSAAVNESFLLLDHESGSSEH